MLGDMREHTLQERLNFSDMPGSTNASVKLGHKRFVRAECNDRLSVFDRKFNFTCCTRPSRQGYDGGGREDIDVIPGEVVLALVPAVGQMREYRQLHERIGIVVL